MTVHRARLRPFAELLILFGLGATLGLAAQWISPTRIPWREDWSRFVQTKALAAGLQLADVQDVVRILDSRAYLVLDARPAADFNAGHLPGALSLPESDLDAAYPRLAPLLTPGQRMLVYCTGHACDESLRLSLFLRERGVSNVVLFVGGYADWTAAGQAVER